MKIRSILYILPFVFILSCKTGPGLKTLLGESSPRDQYIRELRKSDAPEATEWLADGETILTDSLLISLPYREDGKLVSGRTFGYQFTLDAGRRLQIEVLSPDSLFFVDLFRIRENATTQRLAYATTRNRTLAYETTEDVTLIVRIQAPLNQLPTEFSVRMSTQPLLQTFPVAGKSSKQIISFWGAPRDGGARAHEGIDVIAPRGTPLLAAVPGIISRVGVNNLGGNVVSLSAREYNLSLYYAHLDQQLVQEGQRVAAGDTIGTVGNTGNAITTAPHLHFGIYRQGSGYVNPLSFVQVPELPAAGVSRLVADTVRTTEATALFSSLPPSRTTRQRLPKHTVLFTESAAKGYLRVHTAEGIRGYVLANQVQTIDKRVSQKTLKMQTYVYTEPSGELMDTLQSGIRIEVLGTHATAELIRQNTGKKGWISTVSTANSQ